MNYLDFSVFQIENFALVLGRIIGFISVFPIFGSRLFPKSAKIGLSVMLAIIISPSINVVPKVINLWLFILQFSVEILIGLLISFVCYALIYSAAFAGNMIDQQNSLGQAREMDPIFSISTSITGELFFLIFSMTFLYIGGHHFLIQAIVESFNLISIGGVNFLNKDILDIIIMMSSYIFIIGFKIAAPIFASLVVVTVVLGLISKSIPQINVMILGMPLKIGVSLIFTISALPIIKWIFEKGWYDLEHLIVNLLKILGKS